jgi:hypothetical protein
MRTRNLKDGNNAPMSPTSPRSPSMPEFASPHAPFQSMPQSPASPKPRKDSKNIFSNFSATKSSSRLNDSSTRQQPSEPSPTLYANGRGGSSTPDLSRPVRTPNSDGMYLARRTRDDMLTLPDNRSDIVQLGQRTGSGKSAESSDLAADAARRGNKSKKQGALFRSKSNKADEASTPRSKLNKAPPPQLSPDAGSTWTTNSDGVSLKTAPLDKGQTWRNKSALGKLRTHSADRHDGSQLAHRDRAEQSSLTSSSYNENKGASLMSSLGSGARKMGEKMDSARKGMFGKLGRSHSNHESPTQQISNEPYVYRVIHTPLVEQTRLTRISSRLEQSRDKTEFWMPALPWRCIEYVDAAHAFG